MIEAILALVFVILCGYLGIKLADWVADRLEK